MLSNCTQFSTWFQEFKGLHSKYPAKGIKDRANNLISSI
jgi:hypothetical protein